MVSSFMGEKICKVFANKVGGNETGIGKLVRMRRHNRKHMLSISLLLFAPGRVRSPASVLEVENL